MKKTIGSALLTVAALLALFEAPAALARQSDTHPEGGARTWTENFTYRVEIDGVVSTGARLFMASGRPSLLIMAPEIPQPLVLQVDGREVFKTQADDITPGPVPTQVLLTDIAIRGPADPYTREGEAVVFFQKGKKVRIAPRPPIVGPVTFEELIRQLPIYRKGIEEYTPAISDTSYLKTYKKTVEVRVFFGSWCPHCRVLVPMFLKAIQEAANPNIQIALVGMPMPPFGDYPAAKENKIEGVPTFIVFSGDKEVGRFSTFAGDSRVEHELVKILYAFEKEGI